MKKFVFTNEKYQSIQQNAYDALKRRLENVDKSIEATTAELLELEQKFIEQKNAFNAECKTGVRAEKLLTYQWYFPYLKEQQD